MIHLHCFAGTTRKQWQVIPGTRYQSKVLDIELNLAESPKDEPV